MSDNATNLIGESILARKVQHLESEITRLRVRLDAIGRVTADEGIWRIARGLDDETARAISAAQEGE